MNVYIPWKEAGSHERHCEMLGPEYTRYSVTRWHTKWGENGLQGWGVDVKGLNEDEMQEKIRVCR